MKARLVRYEKFVVMRRYVIEISVHELVTTDKYSDGLKWGLICIDRITNRRVLMDNHHPKGPHFHIDDSEFSYEYRNLDQLVLDFRKLIKEHLEVII